MAEIRSTMDMVLERAARMAAEASSETSQEDNIKIGMRIAAEYLNSNEEGSLVEKLQEQPSDRQVAIRKGITDTLLRNIVLPRNETLQHVGLKALQVIAELSGRETSSICAELEQILNQYNQHKEQMQQQLDDSIRAQLEQKLAQQGTQLTGDMSINPAMHPQYREELDRMLSDLNRQYNQALDQRKEMIRARLIPSS